MNGAVDEATISNWKIDKYIVGMFFQGIIVALPVLWYGAQLAAKVETIGAEQNKAALVQEKIQDTVNNIDKRVAVVEALSSNKPSTNQNKENR